MKAKKAIQQKMYHENSRGDDKQRTLIGIFFKLTFFDRFVADGSSESGSE